MLKILIEKEFREIISSKKFVYSFAVCSFLIILTFFVGAKNYEVLHSPKSLPEHLIKLFQQLI